VEDVYFQLTTFHISVFIRLPCLLHIKIFFLFKT